MTTGNHFRLETFEASVQGDAEVVGMLYTGSLGAGTADRYSDLDIELWVSDRIFEDAPIMLRRCMAQLGTVHFMYERGGAFTTGFVGPDWQRVDLVLHRRTETEPSPKYAHVRVLKDTDGTLALMVAGAPEEPIAATWEQARAEIEEAIDSQIYLALHNARGAIWSAMGELSYHCGTLYGFLALLRGHRSYGFRYVEQLLSPAELDMLRDAWPATADRTEVRRAALALWRWTRHVWHEAEIVLARPLEIEVDETSLLAAIDRLYLSD